MRRGQATVELVLGVLVIVPMLLIGIHMAEYAQLSLKVQDAATFAVWDGSGSRVQNFPSSDNTPFNATVRDGSPNAGVAGRARDLYADFDPTLDTGETNVTRARTASGTLGVSCVRNDFAPKPSDIGLPGAFNGIYHSTGGYSCTSESDISAVQIPKEFMMRSQGGFFSQPVIDRASLHVCGMGFPSGSSCQGQLLVLSNDWGLSGEETRECPLGCGSSQYRDLVFHALDVMPPAWGQGLQLAARYAGGASVSYYQFSYIRGDNGAQSIGGETGGDFVTGGVGSGYLPVSTGQNCFLGKCP